METGKGKENANRQKNMLDTVDFNHVQHISFTQSLLTDAVSVILSELLSYEHPPKVPGVLGGFLSDLAGKQNAGAHSERRRSHCVDFLCLLPYSIPRTFSDLFPLPGFWIRRGTSSKTERSEPSVAAERLTAFVKGFFFTTSC